MVALGGCWWPLEIVPGFVRSIGYAFPTAWATDALHQLISIGGELADITVELSIPDHYFLAGVHVAGLKVLACYPMAS